MAGKSTEQAEIQELIRLSEEARSQLGQKIGKYRMALKVPGKMVGAMRRSPKFWLFGSMAAGLGASVLLGSMPKRGKKKRSLVRKMAVALTLTAAKPIAKMWLTNKLKDLSGQWIAERIKAESPKPSPFKVVPKQPDPNPDHVRTPGP